MKRYGNYGKHCEKIGKLWKKPKLNSEKILENAEEKQVEQ